MIAADICLQRFITGQHSKEAIFRYMKITNIEKLPRKKNKIYIDGEYAFMLYDKDIAVYHLDRYTETEDGTEEEFPEHLYDKIMKETVIRRAHQKTLAMLERMDRTETELRQKMKLDMYSEEVADETIKWLKSLHYLDDSRYAQSYIRGHLAGTSRQELIAKLRAKGISKDIANEAYTVCCEEITPAERGGNGGHPDKDDRGTAAAGETTGSIEQQAALRTLSKKLGTRKVLTPKERMSVIGYMLRKGFRRNEIMNAFDELGISIDYEDMPDV